MKLKELGEDRLLAQLLPQLPPGRSVFAGAGDDCALVENSVGRNFLVLKTDCVVEGVHFLSQANALDVGWKAMMRPLSDFAATSAVPQFALITLIVSMQTKNDWVKKIYRGLSRAAARFRVSIVGGETSGTRGPAVISVKIGDDLFVSGRLGGANRRRHLRFVPRIEESRWLTKNFALHAMIDLSDGLGADLPRLARASKVGFKIDKKNLPLNRAATIDNAISDGEDYELLFAISPRDSDRLQMRWRRKFPKLLLTKIGHFNRRSKIENRKLPGGYVHFK